MNQLGGCPLCAQAGATIPNCAFCGGVGKVPIAAGGVRKAPESNPMIRFRDGKHTRSAAIKAMCCHCMGCTYEAIEPGFRTLVRDCTSRGCPLHEFRPFQRADADEADEEVDA